MKKETPIIYLSGFFTACREKDGKKLSVLETVDYWRKRSGANYRCFSFPYVYEKAMNKHFFTKRMKEIYENSVKNKDGIFMDSGAHSFHNFLKKQSYRDLDIEDLKDNVVKTYVDFVRQDGKKWDVYANFDYVHDNETCFKIQKHFMKKGLKTLPVVHAGSDMLDYMKRYVEECGCKYMALGTGGLDGKSNWMGKRKRFDIIFDVAERYGVKLHGFAITQLSLMFMYPWYSTDSATWAKCSAYGKIIFPDLNRNILAMVHVSDHALRRGASDTSYNAMPKDLKRDFVNKVEASGYDFSKLRTSLLERYCYNASIYSKHVHELKEVVQKTRIKWKSLLPL